MSIDSFINDSFKTAADWSEKIIFFAFQIPGTAPDGAAITHSLPVILLWLAAAAVFFTVYLGFINFRGFGHAIDLVRGKHDEPGAKGEINNYQALAACLSGTVGLGNIAGVAVAISVGGPGAAFWMMIMGFLGMSSKFAEVMLGVKYRHHESTAHKDEISGGPMYYLRDIFTARGMPAIGKILAAVFAVCCIGGAFGGGNMFQANQTYMQVVNVTGGEGSWFADKGWLFGIGLAFLTGVVILGGLKSIANVASAIVPVMGAIYLLASLVVIAMNLDKVPQGLADIVRLAFVPEAGFGGLMGSLLVGIQRAAFSNEAGLGSAAIVHAPARTARPVSQGFVGMLGPFIDTVVICMCTALVIVFTGVYEGGRGMEGVELTSRAFESVIPGSRFILAFTVFMFAYSTLITWSYYGEKCLTYLCGDKDWLRLGYRIVFLAFVVIGCASELGNVVRFSDAMILSMAFPNIIGLFVAAPEIRRDVKKYLQDLKKV